MNAKKIFILTFLSTLLVFSSFTALDNKDLKIDKIVIDAGHGGKDPGCQGENSKEAQVSLSVALKLKDIIKEYLPDVDVILTRDNNTFVELHDRARGATGLLVDS